MNGKILFGSVAILLRPERQPKDFALRQRTDSKRAGKQSSRKDCSGVGLETGRFQPATEQERFGWVPDAAEVLSD
ncbi:MAG: hypothetical protein VB109_04780 [Desulfitobacterium hafniense]|uniref:hypothetical protein n=1 Tax=Desulfitobacterium hafniense TaxID=49338 RepID=UPI00037C5A6F|nr:hypothetical protein [Desulfitobacterium hafniense]MEA5022145.1 hypothetical protein [Desulfitobacterium hafniense]